MSIATAEPTESLDIGALAVSETAGFRLCIIRQPFSTVAPEILREFDDQIPQPMDIRLQEVGENQGWHFEDYKSWAELWTEITTYEPDCVFTINRLGSSFDTPLSLLCELWRIPLVQFYVDTPGSQWLQDYEQEMDCILPLVNSRAFLKQLKDRGHRAEFLPMATSEHRFQLPEKENRLYPIIFIGDLGVQRSITIVREVKDKMGGIGTLMTPELNEYIGKAGLWQMEHRAETALQYFDEHQEGFIGCLCQDPRVRSQMVSLVDLQATFLMRREAINLLKPYGIHVWGGEDWRLIVAPEFFHGRIPYPDIHKLYQRANLVLNISKFQSMGVADQRHFDVPMCGATLLTEDHPGQREFFDETEMLYWKDLNELVEQVERFHDVPEACGLVARNAREKILAHHTYATRVGELCGLVRRHKEWLEAKPAESLESRPKLAARFKKWIYAWLERGEGEFAGMVLERSDQKSILVSTLKAVTQIYQGKDPHWGGEGIPDTGWGATPDFAFMCALNTLKKGHVYSAKQHLIRCLKTAPESTRFERLLKILKDVEYPK